MAPLCSPARQQSRSKLALDQSIHPEVSPRPLEGPDTPATERDTSGANIMQARAVALSYRGSCGNLPQRERAFEDTPAEDVCATYFPSGFRFAAARTENLMGHWGKSKTGQRRRAPLRVAGRAGVMAGKNKKHYAAAQRR